MRKSSAPLDMAARAAMSGRRWLLWWTLKETAWAPSSRSATSLMRSDREWTHLKQSQARFPGWTKGTIRIGIKKNREGNNVLTVADNGVSFPEKVDFRNTTSLGLQLVNVLTGQIHGTIELSKAEGTRFVITFPGTTDKNIGIWKKSIAIYA